VKSILEKSILLICIIFFKGVISYAQEKDSIYKKEMSKLKDSILKYDDTNSRHSLKFIKEMVLLSEKNNDTIVMLHLIHTVGRSSQFITEYNQSNNYFEKELNLLHHIDINDKKFKALKNSYVQEVEILAQLGQNYEELGQIKKAFNLFFKCVEIAKRDNLEFYKVIMPSLIGGLYYKTGEYRKALKKEYESFEGLKNSKIIKEINKVYNRVEISIDISNIYLKLHKKDSALWILDAGIKEKLDVYNAYSKLLFKRQRGTIYLETGEPKKALVFLKEAKKLADEYDSINGSTYYYKDLAKCYFKLKKNDSAIFVLEKGIRTKKLNSKEFYLANDYKLLAKIYKEVGDLEKSNEYYEKYIINQTALEKSKDTIVSSFHDREVSSLNNEKVLQNKKLSVIIVITSAIGLLFLLTLIWFYKQKKKNELKFQELLDKTNLTKETKPEIVDTKDIILEEKTTSEVAKETTKQILEGLQKLEEQAYFLKQECNSYNVAKKIKTNTSYLSKVINSNFQKNFNTYINDLRINYAIVQLKENSRFRSFSIQSIAEELGYKSADSFTKYFKLRTGLNPSFYIKQLNSLT